MKVFLTGGTGYVGSHVLQALLDAGHEVVALVRPGSESDLPVAENTVDIVPGDALVKESYVHALEDCEAIIHLIGIIREFPQRGITFEKLHVDATRNILDAAREHGISRFIHMSALGAKSDSKSGYFKTKARAEAQVEESGMDYTIIRPSIIFGPDDDFINYFVGMMKSFHVIPIIGDGRYRMQPVYVNDVSQAFVRSLQTSASVGKTYEVAGPTQYIYKEMIKIVRSTINTWALIIHPPKTLMTLLAKMFQYFAFFPVTEAQIIMLYDENITDDDRWKDDLNIAPKNFEKTIAEYL